MGPTAPTGGWVWIPCEDEEEAALKPADDNPDATFSSLPTDGGDNNDDARGEPRIVHGNDGIDAEELVGCNEPEEAAAAAAAINVMKNHKIN